MHRDLRIDTIRGLLLVLITVNHFGSWSSEGWWVLHFTWQPLGYVSAAEGFVFVSGFVFARVYARHTPHPATLWKVACQRAFHIYAYHLLMLLGLAASFLVVPLYHTLWQEWFAPPHLLSFPSLLASLLFLHQPPYLDILPMYAVFVLLSPLVLRLLHHHKVDILLTVSVTLWLFGQHVHLGEVVTTLLVPGHQPGHFNLLSWQLLYVLGLLLGSNAQRNGLGPFLTCKPLMGFMFLCALGLLLSRHALIFPEIADGIDRASLGWLRVVNCLLLIALISARLLRLPASVQVPWLAFLGQHSLPVFSFHIVSLYLLTPLTSFMVATLGSAGLLIVMMLMVCSLRVPALLHRKSRTWAVPFNPPDYSAQQKVVVHNAQELFALRQP